MSGTHRARFCARVLTFALALVSAGAVFDAAAARPRAKKPLVSDADATALNWLPPTSTPAKVFTINQVLAKHDRLAGKPGATQLAAFDPAGDPAGTLTDAPARSATLPPRGEEPFGLFVFRAPEGALWVKWRGVETDIQKEAEALARCRANAETCSAAAARFTALIAAARARQGRARIEVVNSRINAAIRYTSDLVQHGALDRWTAPLATFAAGRGDCEDFAIAKYVALREAGVGAGDLRLMLVRDRQARDDHAVLAVREGGRWLVLDNRRDSLFEDADLAHFVPLFALDHEGVKLFAAPYAARQLRERDFADWPLRGTEFAARTPREPDFADWTLLDSAFAAWTLRGNDLAPAAAADADAMEPGTFASFPLLPLAL